MTERFAYSLREVAEMTGLPERAIRDRLREIPHVRLSSKSVVMTPAQVEAMLRLFTRSPDAGSEQQRVAQHRDYHAARLAGRRLRRVA